MDELADLFQARSRFVEALAEEEDPLGRARDVLAGLPEEARSALGASVPFPRRLGLPDEYAALACHIVENEMLNGEVIRLDGALRMAPK